MLFLQYPCIFQHRNNYHGWTQWFRRWCSYCQSRPWRDWIGGKGERRVLSSIATSGKGGGRLPAAKGEEGHGGSSIVEEKGGERGINEGEMGLLPWREIEEVEAVKKRCDYLGHRFSERMGTEWWKAWRRRRRQLHRPWWQRDLLVGDKQSMNNNENKTKGNLTNLDHSWSYLPWTELVKKLYLNRVCSGERSNKGKTTATVTGDGGVYKTSQHPPTMCCGLCYKILLKNIIIILNLNL